MARYIDGAAIQEGRYAVYENGVQVKNVSLSPDQLAEAKAEARAKKIALIEVLRRREGITQKDGLNIVQVSTEAPLVLSITEGDTGAAAPVPPHRHEEHEHDTEHEHDPHEHKDKADIDQLVQLRFDLLGHGHDDLAPRGHGHPHLEDSVVRATEGTIRLGIEVSKVAESVKTHEHDLAQHGHKGFAPEVHEHDYSAMGTATALLGEAVAALIERITALEEAELPDHDHDNYAGHGHRHDEEAKVTGRRRNAPAHDHVFDTKVGTDKRWRCGICGVIEG